ncbi:MAG: hypothetical protein WDW36_002570 [Sanguina aurantia]
MLLSQRISSHLSPQAGGTDPSHLLKTSDIASGEDLSGSTSSHSSLDSSLDNTRTLSFEVCQGMANQRLSLVYGIILAAELHRNPILPNFPVETTSSSSGTINTDTDTATPSSTSRLHGSSDAAFDASDPSGSEDGVGDGAGDGVGDGTDQEESLRRRTRRGALPMELLYDVDHLIASLSSVGVTLLPHGKAPPAASLTHIDASTSADVVELLGGTPANKLLPHIAIGCPLYRLNSYYLSTSTNSRLVWAILGGLRPSTPISHHVSQMAAAIAASPDEAGSYDTARTAGSSSRAKRATQREADGLEGGKGADVGMALQQRPRRRGAFTFLHLRIERDWLGHCQRWEAALLATGKVTESTATSATAAAADAPPRDSAISDSADPTPHTASLGCTDSSVDNIAAFLISMNVPTSEPLYVSSYWDDVSPTRKATLLESLSTAGYTVVTSANFPARAKFAPSHDVGLNALLDFELSLLSSRSVGHSVSSFSALALLQRRHLGRWASYYNGGAVPLAELLPLERLPWVFSYSSATPHLDYSLKAAVRSALRHRTLLPVCLFTIVPPSELPPPTSTNAATGASKMGGNSSSSKASSGVSSHDPATTAIGRWLVEAGVSVVTEPQPSWLNMLWRTSVRAGRRMEQRPDGGPTHGRGLYPTRTALLNAFMSLQLPATPLLEQYTYVLYTSPHVFFQKRLTLGSFGLPLPPVLSMVGDVGDAAQLSGGGPASAETFGSVAGVDADVMLVNLPALRTQHAELITFVVYNRHGGHFPSYGLGGPGAYLQFYEAAVRYTRLAPAFGAKAYAGHDTGAVLVHWAGPKPHEYLEYHNSMDCSSGSSLEGAAVAALGAGMGPQTDGRCEAAWKRGLCPYVKRWHTLLNESESTVGLRLWYACASLYAPHLQGLCIGEP